MHSYSEDILNCDYKVHSEYENQADFVRVSQNQSNLFKFCVIACMTFDLGFNPIFDFYINKI